MTESTIYASLNPALDEIRVLHVSPAMESSHPIHAQLETISLQRKPAAHYEAVSYCWGNPTRQEVIVINSLELAIPASSVEVLRRFRHSDQLRTLWIDAICINQADFSERAQQVMLMGSVYSKSAHTLIWLGDPNDTTQRAIECIQNNAGLIRVLLQAYGGDTQALEADFATAKVDRDPANILAIQAFFTAAWFTRVWVSQEAFLSPKATCYCGDYEASWDDVCLAAYAEAGIHQADFGSGRSSGASRAYAGISKALQGLVWIERNGNEVVPCLAAFLASGRALHTTDARDYIYGLLGFPTWLQTGQSLPEWFKVDYEQPVSVILRDATRLAIAEARNLEVFEHVDGFERRNEHTRIAGSLPSWAPTWDAAPQIQANRFVDFDTYSASGSPEVDSALVNDYSSPDSLLTQGYEVEHVTELLPSFEVTDEARVFGEFGDYLSKSLRFRSIPEVKVKIVLAITAGRLHLSIADVEILTADVAEWEATGFDFRSPPFQEGTGGRKMIADLFMKAHKDRLLRRLFVLGSGEVGLGPLATQVGDCVAILHGSAMPIVLRRPAGRVPEPVSKDLLRSRTVFEVLGQAFVSGMMSGEVIEAREAAGVEPKIIELV